MPGDAEKSLLVRAVLQTGDLKMPMGGKLPDNQIEDLKTWIRAGAIWPQSHTAKANDGDFSITGPQRGFWSFKAFGNTAPPNINDKRAVNYIDRFLLARLKEEGIEPVAPADKRTLIRRATYDLTGLPPTPEEVDAFLRDRSPDAFAKVADRLLASPRYGERWGRHWLDVARYADSSGFQYDRDRPTAWIRAVALGDSLRVEARGVRRFSVAVRVSNWHSLYSMARPSPSPR